MATKSANDVVQGGNIPLPKDRYQARIKSASFGMSKSSNKPQITLDCEIIRDEPLEVDGKKYSIGGLEFKLYAPLGEEGLWKTFEFHKKLDLPDTIDDENPDVSIYAGIGFDIILSSREKKATRPDPNKKGAYIPIRDAAGKEVILGFELNAQLDDVLCRVELNTTNKF